MDAPLTSPLSIAAPRAPELPAADNRPSLAEPALPVVVPIRSLGSNHRGRIVEHLLALSPRDRYLRFGYAASDAQIARYVQGMDFVRDEIFGIYNRRLRLIAMAHLAYPVGASRSDPVEFGVSVASAARGRGYGARLFERAAMHARNDGFSQMFIHALSENTAMLRIARAAGAVVRRDGSEAEAYLQLPAATFDSRVVEMLQEQIGQIDYGMKSHTRHLLQMLGQWRAQDVDSAA